MGKIALISGVSGQDGAYLARFLLSKGYHVVGTSRDAQLASFDNLKRLDILDRVQLESMILTDFRSTLQTLAKAEPDEVYNLAGQSSVGLSFHQPMETMESITLGTLNLMEVIRILNRNIKLYNASSSECFGDTAGEHADEETPFRPRSPYAVAKAAAHWAVVNYRDAYHLFACNGILFNHESPLRPRRFVTQTIISSAYAISRGVGASLRLGNIEICRDWGFAAEYVEAMWLLLQQAEPGDIVIATGETRSLRNFVDTAFEAVGLNYGDYVVFDPELKRPSDIPYSAGNPERASRLLGWRAQKKMTDVVKLMMDAHRMEDAEGDGSETKPVGQDRAANA